ncbi:unnamed protein product [Candida verbasci]|uniref:Dolichyl-diphosphooligosaccharide--protein glycosyltransferase subunit OST2 n=1 Tax=Candida verbasci TaxID=1227364 RepID=A0A9W4TYR1_9ASCO|nr:unnamed protein product [Candida verbasci]
MVKDKSIAIKKAAQAQSRATPTTPATTVVQPVSTTFHELQSAINTTFKDYFRNLTPRTKLIDLFLLFLVLLGVLQFIYVLLIGNFPFNAFLGGFISCVGQFVLLVSLRLQINDETKEGQVEGEEDSKIFKFISPERSFGDFIFASLILHFIVIHFIN